MILKGYLALSLTLFVAVSNALFATKVNSYSSFSANNTEDSLYYDVFLKYRVKNLDSAAKYAQLSYVQSMELNDIELTIKSLNAMGYCYRKKFIYDSALYAYKNGVQQSKIAGNEVRQIIFFNNIGIVYDDIGVYDSAMANFFNSLDLAKKLERPYDESVALLNIGNIDWDLGNAKSAINFYLQSLEIKKEYDLRGMEFCYSNLGLSYSEIEDHENAIYYFNKLIEFCENGSCNTNMEEKALIGLGKSYMGLGDLDLAYFYINEVIDSEDVQIEIFAYRSLAELAIKHREYEKALEYINTSTRLANATKRIESIKNNYVIKSNIFKEMGMADSSLVYSQYHYTLKDSLFNETVAKSIQDLFVGFERAQAEATIQDKEREISIRKRTNILFALVIVLSLAIIIKAIMDLTKRKKMNKYLDKQVALKTSELTESNKHLQEKSKDLNDLIYNISHEIRGPLARLLGLINLGQMESHKELKEVKYYRKLQNEVVDLESILKRMTIINYVNHHDVNIVGIKPVEFFKNLISNSRYLWQDKIEIDLELDGVKEIRTDTELLEIALQNIITNAVEFRNPGNTEDSILNIKLQMSPKSGVDIILVDNGVGFDEKYKDSVTDLFFVASEKGGAGIGLHQTKLALAKLGGSIEIPSTRNPTTFIVHL